MNEEVMKSEEGMEGIDAAVNGLPQTIETTEDKSQEVDDFRESLDVMWKGMTAIFVVILAIVLLVVVLNKVTNKKSNKQNSLSE